MKLDRGCLHRKFRKESWTEMVFQPMDIGYSTVWGIIVNAKTGQVLFGNMKISPVTGVVYSLGENDWLEVNSSSAKEIIEGLKVKVTYE